MYQPVEIPDAIVTREAGEYVAVEQNVCGRGWEPGSGGTTKSGGPSARPRSPWPTGCGPSGARRTARSSRSGLAVGRPAAEGRRTLRGRRLHLPHARRRRCAARALRPRQAVEGRGAREAPAGVHGQETGAVFRAKPEADDRQAVVPATSTKPCNLAGFSNMMTVGESPGRRGVDQRRRMASAVAVAPRGGA